MIGYLDGQLLALDNQTAIILVGGVGYRVTLASSSHPPLGNKIKIWIHAHVREDRFELYGFPERKELILFEKLLDVSGVGPKMALGLVGGGAATMISAIVENNLSIITAVPGVGPKLARKIIVELGEKLGNLDIDAALTQGSDSLKETLVGLGFKPAEINQVLRQLPADLKTPEEKIKFALQKIGRS